MSSTEKEKCGNVLVALTKVTYQMQNPNQVTIDPSTIPSIKRLRPRVLQPPGITTRTSYPYRAPIHGVSLPSMGTQKQQTNIP